jgi:hypothetical protein
MNAKQKTAITIGVAVIVAMGLMLALALNGPNAIEWLKEYQGATFRWAKFAEHDVCGILHEAYVTGYDTMRHRWMARR